MKNLNSVISIFLAVCILISTSHAAGPDAEALDLITKLGLKEATEPVNKSSVWKIPEKVYISIPFNAVGREKELLKSVKEIVGNNIADIGCNNIPLCLFEQRSNI